MNLHWKPIFTRLTDAQLQQGTLLSADVGMQLLHTSPSTISVALWNAVIPSFQEEMLQFAPCSVQVELILYCERSKYIITSIYY